MTTFHPPRERLDSLAERIVQQLGAAPAVTVKNPEGVRAVVRALLADNLREEHELEQEVLETLRRHGQAIYEQNADFQKMFHDGKKILAKKKGFTL
jgi:hypothetical protein